MTVMTLSCTMFNPHGCEILVLKRNLHDTFRNALRKKVERFIIKARNIGKCTAAWHTVFQGRSVSVFALDMIFVLRIIPSLRFTSRDALCVCSVFSTLLCNGISGSGHSSCNQQAASGTNWKAICASLQNCAPPLNKAIKELNVISEHTAQVHRLQKVF